MEEDPGHQPEVSSYVYTLTYTYLHKHTPHNFLIEKRIKFHAN